MPNSEIIELLTRLREIEPDSQGIVDRCDAAIAELKWTEPSPNAKAWNTTVAGRMQTLTFNGKTYHRVGNDVHVIRDGEEVRIK